MAAFDFPINPIDGQFYPDPPIPGAIQYVWSSTKGAWLTVNQGVSAVQGRSPISVQGSKQVPIVTIPAATETRDGYMSAADKAKLDSFGAVSRIQSGTGISVDPPEGVGDVTINVVPSQGAILGAVYAGTGLRTFSGGRLDLQPASTAAIGGVKIGSGINVSPDGTISAPGGITILRDISPAFNGIQTTFTLQRLDGSVYFPAATNSLLLFVGGVVQIPGNSFGVQGSQVIFTQAPPTGATFYGLAIN